MQEQIKCVHVLNILGLDLQQRLCVFVCVCDGTGEVRWGGVRWGGVR